VPRSKSHFMRILRRQFPRRTISKRLRTCERPLDHDDARQPWSQNGPQAAFGGLDSATVAVEAKSSDGEAASDATGVGNSALTDARKTSTPSAFGRNASTFLSFSFGNELSPERSRILMSG